VFLDANVLYSAAWLENSGLLRLWRLSGVELLSASYAIAEARRNLSEDRLDALARLDKLLRGVEVVDEGEEISPPGSVQIDPKDKPILLAAVRGNAGFLLTGDKRHFGHLYGQTVRGVTICRPPDYLRGRRLKRRPR
jgi:predicted nucleic acid-binding protein